MRNDMSIQGVSPVTSTGDPAPALKEPAPAAASSPASAVAAPSYVSPALRLEPELGLVVIEFRNSAGTVTDSIPTARQLHEYKQHARIEIGSAQAGSGLASPSGRDGLKPAGGMNDPATSANSTPGTSTSGRAPAGPAGETWPFDAHVEASI